jgi:predicted oxidoreductase (fatty acid repression mutant protein)
MVLADMIQLESALPAHALADLMARRRSIRQLRDGSLPRGALARIVAAARSVPAAYNRPPWHIVVVHERSGGFWDVVEAAFRDRLGGDRLARYLDRLAGFRGGVGAVLVYEDRTAVEEMRQACGIDHDQARAYSEQGLGMVQLALWLAIVAEGLGASLQHWEALIEDRVAAFLGLPADRFRLAATMPLGFPAEEPRPAQPPDAWQVVSLDAYARGGEILQHM